MNINQVTIFGKKVYPFTDENELLSFILDKKGVLIAVGGEKLMNEDSRLTNIINSNYAYCDGYAAQYAVCHRGYPNAAKIPGAYLWQSLVSFFPTETKYYFLGAKEEVINDTVNKMRREHVNIQIVGYRNGYFSEDDEALILEEIENCGADVVFVALGSPKQEFLMSRFSQKYPALYMGLGGSFDLYTGRAKPVPLWWNKIFKWEGLYRQLCDFTNLKRWKRQCGAHYLVYRLWTGKF